MEILRTHGIPFVRIGHGEVLHVFAAFCPAEAVDKRSLELFSRLFAFFPAIRAMKTS